MPITSLYAPEWILSRGVEQGSKRPHTYEYLEFFVLRLRLSRCLEAYNIHYTRDHGVAPIGDSDMAVQLLKRFAVLGAINLDNVSDEFGNADMQMSERTRRLLVRMEEMAFHRTTKLTQTKLNLQSTCRFESLVEQSENVRKSLAANEDYLPDSGEREKLANDEIEELIKVVPTGGLQVVAEILSVLPKDVDPVLLGQVDIYSSLGDVRAAMDVME